ncbi:hypothetical protein PED39_05050 [Methanomassiliicoccales archaeon LGM-RCC1]|nr:hypothetical protein [Candidatus Methanomethylophilaceae archaeon]WII06958.1 hypothetical protein PED39_05050 [Methanomassiliicoccales archaeon LGM-RCC1]
MTLEEYVPEWVITYLAPIVLLLGGIMAIIIVVTYLKDKDSGKYKACVAIGTLLGIVIVLLAVLEGFHAETYSLVLIALAAFTLIIRPIREIHISVIIGMLVMAIVYIALARLNGVMVGEIDLSILATGWYRIGIAFVCGAIVYGLLNFAEAIVKVVGTFLNCWPVLFILGLLCIGEAICQYFGYGSIIDYILQIPWDEVIPHIETAI